MEPRSIFTPNDEQRAAIEHRGSPLRIIAGAGTGKTATLTRRFVSIVEDDGIPVGEVLALTFTRKAANEMKERIVGQLNRSYTEFWVETFHSFCKQALRLEHMIQGIPPPSVVDGQGRLTLLRDATGNEHFPSYGSRRDDFERQALTFIDRAKDELLTVDDAYSLATHRDSPQLHDLARAYDLYQHRLTGQRRLFDWGELQTRLIELLEQDDVRERWAGKFKHLLVDEFQDVNEAQCRLVELLVSDGAELTVVGDVDQSIYAFRGASHQILSAMPERFPGTHTIYLTSNFRSHQAILDTGNALIGHNPDTHQRRQLSAFDERIGALPTVIETRDEQEEADAIARQIARLHYVDGVPLNDIAVLLRSVQTTAGPIEQALAAYGLRTATSEEIETATDATADVLAVLRLIEGDDDASLIHLLTCQDINPIQILSAEIEENGSDLHLIARLERLDPAAGARARRTQSSVHQLAGRSLPEQVYEAARICGRLPLGEDISRDDFRYVQSLRSILQRATELAERGGTAADFIGEIAAALPARPENDPEQETVQILTVHAAKGLEFRHVFVAGLAHGRFPLTRRLDRGLDLTQPESLHPDRASTVLDDATRRLRFLEEERRLGYVALTRAIDYLYMSYAKTYSGSGQAHSIFLRDIQSVSESLVEKTSVLTPEEGAWNAAELARVHNERISRALDHPTFSGAAIGDLMLGQLTLTGLPDASPWRSRTEPFPHDGTESLRLSFSALDSYATCPRRYYYKEVLRLPDPTRSPYMTRGTILHDVIQWINEQRMTGTYPAWTEVRNQIDAIWPDGGFDSPAQEEQIRQQCEALLQRFHAYEREQQREILGVEWRFEAEFGRHTLTGRIDCIARMPDGTIEIIDYKSGKSPPYGDSRRLQLGIYQIASSRQYPDAEPRAVIYLLGQKADDGVHYAPEFDPAKQLVGERLDDSTIDAVEDRVHDIAGSILRNEFPVTTNPRECLRCAYRYVCEGANDGG